MFRINYQSIFFAGRPVDFRKSINGLYGEVKNTLGADPQSGSLFVFTNKRRDALKLLFWEDDGFWLLYKRLEAGTFELPLVATGAPSVSISYGQLQWILAGVELGSISLRKRYKKAS
jgi:transposase